MHRLVSSYFAFFSARLLSHYVKMTLTFHLCFTDHTMHVNVIVVQTNITVAFAVTAALMVTVEVCLSEV